MKEKQNRDQKWKSQAYIKYLFSISYVKNSNKLNEKQEQHNTII